MYMQSRPSYANNSIERYLSVPDLSKNLKSKYTKGKYILSTVCKYVNLQGVPIWMRLGVTHDVVFANLCHCFPQTESS